MVGWVEVELEIAKVMIMFMSTAFLFPYFVLHLKRLVASQTDKGNYLNSISAFALVSLAFGLLRMIKTIITMRA